MWVGHDTKENMALFFIVLGGGLVMCVYGLRNSTVTDFHENEIVRIVDIKTDKSEDYHGTKAKRSTGRRTDCTHFVLIL